MLTVTECSSRRSRLSPPLTARPPPSVRGLWSFFLPPSSDPSLPSQSSLPPSGAAAALLIDWPRLVALQITDIWPSSLYEQRRPGSPTPMSMGASSSAPPPCSSRGGCRHAVVAAGCSARSGTRALASTRGRLAGPPPCTPAWPSTRRERPSSPPSRRSTTSCSSRRHCSSASCARRRRPSSTSGPSSWTCRATASTSRRPTPAAATSARSMPRLFTSVCSSSLQLSLFKRWSLLIPACLSLLFSCVRGRNFVDDRGEAPRHMGHLWYGIGISITITTMSSTPMLTLTAPLINSLSLACTVCFSISAISSDKCT